MPTQIIRIASLAIIILVFNFLMPLKNISVVSETQKNKQTETNKKFVLSQINIEAKSACVFDIAQNKFLFELNYEKPMPLASLTKLMTAITAKENMPETLEIEISKEAVTQEGDSGLKIGETISLKKLLPIMLVSSSNDAAFAIATSLKTNTETNEDEFVKLMNKKARGLNFSSMYFSNSTGLDISETQAGAYGSCKDMTDLMKYILNTHANLLEPTEKEWVYLDDGRKFENTNKLLSKLPSFIGGKTGSSDLAGGNFTVALDEGLNHPLIITVLGSTTEGRFKDVETLLAKIR
ncbi:MAG: serine hydrolase [bacterium]|nr:serine hydrolase [bacterium]